MAAARTPLAQWGHSLLSQSRNKPDALSRICLACQSRYASAATTAKYRRGDANAPTKKKKERKHFKTEDLKNADKYSLVEAMRYIRAFEVGYPSNSPKYEIAMKLRTLKNGPLVRSRLNLPHPVKTDMRICVICPPDSPQADAARAAGASLVGEDAIFDAVKEGRIEFDRCLCLDTSLPKLAKAGIARALGPRGLMPSAKTGTVVRDVSAAVRDMVGASEYREKEGVVRLAIATLAATPEQLKANIKAFMDKVRGDLNTLSDRIVKDVHEVVLSSTHGPGFTLNGEFADEEGTRPEELAR
ncbi:ribosomal protein L1 [Rhizodiscina lignyota]|uniref:Ribosomal protein L1 n=1 Tax=Rhizodiscina lignyota TaxID=1504668 RepID=A0A9P4I9Y0_9PEZI|nr:ribosomal protein L1 [Rhizodiscina lignyota]